MGVVTKKEKKSSSEKEGSSSSSTTASSSDDDSSSSNSSSSSDDSSDEDSSASSQAPTATPGGTKAQDNPNKDGEPNRPPSRPSSVASSIASSTRSRSSSKAKSKKKPPPTTPPVSKKKPDSQQSTPSNPKSKLVKSGTVTNTRTIKPLIPVKKTPSKKAPNTNNASNSKEKKTPTVKTKPAKKAPSVVTTAPTTKTPTVTKLPGKSINNSSPKIRKLPGKSMANVTKQSVKKPAKKPESSLIIRTRSSCSSEALSSSEEEEPVSKNKVVLAATSTLKKKDISTEEESDSKSKVVKKRPVTRRQKLNKKTIPTTTLFNQSLLLAATKPAVVKKKQRSSSLSSSASSPTHQPLPTSNVTTLNKNKYLSTWDSDFSDDASATQQQNSNLIRVPAKTSSKPIANLPSDYFDYYQPPTCPFPSCDSTGHLSGKYPNHNFLSCCPKYNGLTETECEQMNTARSRRETERSRYRNILSTPGKKPPKQTSDTKEWLGEIKDLKQNQMGIVSSYDDLLWKDALAIAADCIEKEQNEGGINNQNNLIMMQNNVYRMATMAVAMGRFEMKCWCDSPYPEPLSRNRRLFVCEFCLKPVMSGTVLRRHCAKCVWRHPPGDEIYRKDRLSVWEVDGKKQKTYCQNLCLLAKCFLDHKTLYLDVDPFLFYVMTLADSQGCHIVGYFSKEKNSFLNYNVSCILTLPPYQRQGFGRLLIDFSYLLTRVEGKVGSPEKPLSDLGLISYRSYWKDACLRRLCACASREINIKDLSIELGVSTADLISTLQYLGMLKYWKGKHLVLKKQDVLEEYLERVRRRGNDMRQIDSSCLRWRPYQPPADEHSSEENKS